MRALTAAGDAALAVGCGVIALLHVVGPGAAISPITKTISEYGLTSLAWAFDLAVLAVAAGSAAILVAVATTGRRMRDGHRPDVGYRAGQALGALWVLGLVVLAAFPKTDWALGPSVSGQIHRAAGLVGFLALPIAVWLLLRGAAARGRPGRRLAKAGAVLAPAAFAWPGPVVVAIVAGAGGGAWWTAVPLGLLERGMAVTEIAALVVLGVWADAVARASARATTPGAARDSGTVTASAAVTVTVTDQGTVTDASAVTDLSAVTDPGTIADRGTVTDRTAP